VLDGFGESSRLWLFAAGGVLITALLSAWQVREGSEHNGRRARLLAEVKDCATFTLDPAGNIDAWVFGGIGGSGEEMVGESFSAFYAAEDLERGLPEEELRAAAGTRATRAKDGGWAGMFRGSGPVWRSPPTKANPAAGADSPW
jgi:hypothetical protein